MSNLWSGMGAMESNLMGAQDELSSRVEELEGQLGRMAKKVAVAVGKWCYVWPKRWQWWQWWQWWGGNGRDVVSSVIRRSGGSAYAYGPSIGAVARAYGPSIGAVACGGKRRCGRRRRPHRSIPVVAHRASMAVAAMTA